MVRTGRPKAELVLAPQDRDQLLRWARQRTAHPRGVLPTDRTRRLESCLNGSGTADAAWDDSHAILLAFADAYGSVAEDVRGPSVSPAAGRGAAA